VARTTPAHQALLDEIQRLRERITELETRRSAEAVPGGADLTEVEHPPRQNEDALKESEERLHVLVTATSDVVYRMSPDWTNMIFLHGRDFIPDTVEPSATWLQKYIPADDQKAVMVAIDQAIRTKSTFQLEHRVLRVDGSTGWTFSRAIPIQNSQGEIVEWFGAASDITERKQAADDALQESRAILQSFYDTAPFFMGIDELDSDRAVAISGNRAVAESLSAGTVHLPWRNGSALDDATDLERLWVENYWRAQRDGAPVQFEYERPHKASPHWFRATVAFMGKGSTGRPRFSFVVEDITERKRTGELLRQSQKLESLGRLAGGIAHDYNNLLSAVMLNVDSALDDLGTGDPAISSVTAIRNLAERAIAFGQQLMALSGKRVQQTEVLDFDSVISENEKLLRRLIGDNVEVVFRPKAGLMRVKADRGQIWQIIMNLVVNSRDAMPEGGRLTIETATVQIDEAGARINPEATPGPYVRLAVRDTGTGMSKETASRVFEPFFTTKEIASGTGLGLSVVYGIVKQYRGFIIVESELGHGSEFRIYLPAVAEAPDSIPEAEDSPAKGGSETILLAEDESFLRQKVCEVLQAAGYHVLVAECGQVAYRLAVQDPQPIHLLLTDVVMPQMSGLRLSESLLTIRPEIKTLYMSGYPNAGDTSLDLQSHANFLEKPFTREQLLRKVRAVLGPESSQG
jgi:signal transduction histidine kinase/CheY-like chemotaxis protein